MEPDALATKVFSYFFLDESGNLDFSPKGTRHFSLVCLSKVRPFEAYKDLVELKYDLAEEGTELEYFHAAEDRQLVRNRVFGIIAKHLEGVRLDALVVDKSKVAPASWPVERFYPNMVGRLLRRVIRATNPSGNTEILIYTDSVPVERKRNAIEKGIKEVLAETLPIGVRYRIMHHASKSNLDLQIADYCNWAVFRAVERGDHRALAAIRRAFCTEEKMFGAEGETYD
ncbi:MAG TPA: DUF3800 domain-containing protein [Methylomirabilota bacterium]|nr:DUF3800 domain-containing protein [Methylomirabilota bacterium]